MTRNTLPLPVAHLHPGISKPQMNIKRLARGISAPSLEGACRDGRTAVCDYLHIVVGDAVILGRFRICKRLGLAGDFSIVPRVYELLSQT